jgi:hypothetical protein
MTSSPQNHGVIIALSIANWNNSLPLALLPISTPRWLRCGYYFIYDLEMELEDRQALARDIHVAQAAGARLVLACEIVGVALRTLQRWKGVDGNIRPERLQPETLDGAVARRDQLGRRLENAT